ncbi:methyltransferase family protein [Pseudarthrobacter sp. DSP2-3-2b1]|uniref:methyltransferase family protein n=1 Tax=Pseudarthrobacter sp. DSP2-3-2b1 TaxID=2804661 RepID=UPI003CF3B55F
MTGKRDRKRLLSNIPLPEQNLAGLAAGLVLQRVVPLRIGRPSGPASPLLTTAGAASLAAGGTLVTWAWFAARNTRLAHPEALVTGGPYAFSRNPMYLGCALIQLGAGLLQNNAWMVAALPVASAAMHREVLREEAFLAEAFGERFTQYRRSVPRYAGSALAPGSQCRREGRR